MNTVAPVRELDPDFLFRDLVPMEPLKIAGRRIVRGVSLGLLFSFTLWTSVLIGFTIVGPLVKDFIQ